jgi:hypothetical protein
MPGEAEMCSTFEQVFISEIVVHDVGFGSGQVEPEPIPPDKSNHGVSTL